jgi:hypothetical protein
MFHDPAIVGTEQALTVEPLIVQRVIVLLSGIFMRVQGRGERKCHKFCVSLIRMKDETRENRAGEGRSRTNRQRTKRKRIEKYRGRKP